MSDDKINQCYFYSSECAEDSKIKILGTCAILKELHHETCCDMICDNNWVSTICNIENFNAGCHCGKCIKIRHPDNNENNQLIDDIADHVHWIWSHWMKHFIGNRLHQSVSQSQYEYFIKPKDMERWKRQMITSYWDLSDKEKESDRELAKQIIDNFSFNPFTGEKL